MAAHAAPRVDVQFAEVAAKGQMLLLRQMLIAEKDDRVLPPAPDGFRPSAVDNCSDRHPLISAPMIGVYYRR